MESNNITQVNILNPEAFKQDIIEAVIKELSKSPKAPTQIKEEAPIYLSRAEAAKMLKVTTTTLYKWGKLGIITPKRIGKRVLFDKSELEAAMA